MFLCKKIFTNFPQKNCFPKKNSLVPFSSCFVELQDTKHNLVLFCKLYRSEFSGKQRKYVIWFQLRFHLICFHPALAGGCSMHITSFGSIPNSNNHRHATALLHSLPNSSLKNHLKAQTALRVVSGSLQQKKPIKS